MGRAALACCLAQAACTAPLVLELPAELEGKESLVVLETDGSDGRASGHDLRADRVAIAGTDPDQIRVIGYDAAPDELQIPLGEIDVQQARRPLPLSGVAFARGVGGDSAWTAIAVPSEVLLPAFDPRLCFVRQQCPHAPSVLELCEACEDQTPIQPPAAPDLGPCRPPFQDDPLPVEPSVTGCRLSVPAPSDCGVDRYPSFGNPTCIGIDPDGDSGGPWPDELPAGALAWVSLTDTPPAAGPLYPTVHEALARAALGGIDGVVVGRGTYAEPTLELPAGVWLAGASATRTRIDTDGISPPNSLLNLPSGSSTVSDISFGDSIVVGLDAKLSLTRTRMYGPLVGLRLLALGTARVSNCVVEGSNVGQGIVSEQGSLYIDGLYLHGHENGIETFDTQIEARHVVMDDVQRSVVVTLGRLQLEEVLARQARRDLLSSGISVSGANLIAKRVQLLGMTEFGIVVDEDDPGHVVEIEDVRVEMVADQPLFAALGLIVQALGNEPIATRVSIARVLVMGAANGMRVDGVGPTTMEDLLVLDGPRGGTGVGIYHAAASSTVARALIVFGGDRGLELSTTPNHVLHARDIRVRGTQSGVDVDTLGPVRLERIALDDIEREGLSTDETPGVALRPHGDLTVSDLHVSGKAEAVSVTRGMDWVRTATYLTRFELVAPLGVGIELVPATESGNTFEGRAWDGRIVGTNIAVRSTFSLDEYARRFLERVLISDNRDDYVVLGEPTR